MKDLSKKYFQSKLSPEEYVIFCEYVKEPNNNILEEVSLELWEDSLKNKGSNKSNAEMLKSIQYTIFKEEKLLDTRKRKLYQIGLRVAAVLILGLSLFRLSQITTDEVITANKEYYCTVTAPYGATTELTLSDGSEIWLNSGSTLTYSNDFLQHRKVILEGEAYFDVTHNETPFIVHANQLDIKVLGTLFNVKSYSDESTIETTVEEGIVQVSYKRKENIEKNTYSVKKGQYLLFNNITKGFQLKEGDTHLYTSWKEGYYKFHKIKLNQLAKTIERLYNIDISIDRNELSNMTFTGSFYKDETVDKVLEMVERSTLDIRIVKQGYNKFLIVSKSKG